MVKLFRLLKEYNEFCNPQDQLSQIIHQVLDENDIDNGLLSEDELSYINAAMGHPNHKMPEQDKEG